jgi:2-succinyl-5-enolpyruvyl-6-hydroxy-3-cyclohexene-1-carboxylate synthase
MEPFEFLSKWLPQDVGSQPINSCHEVNQSHQALLTDYFLTRPHSDLKVFYQLSKTFPKGAQIQMGNSSAVRYLQLMDQRADLTFFGNRGVSGIDGCTSTAIGAAKMIKEKVILVTGDLSFLYDANALWQAQWPTNLKIVLIDNGGGGIFRIIEGAKTEPSVPRLFETPHGRDIQHWVEGWDLSATVTSDVRESDFQAFFDHPTTAIMIVKTQAELNPIELDLFFQHFKEYNERVENH